MSQIGLEEEKDLIIRSLTDSYARGGMDMQAFERSVSEVNACPDRLALAASAAALGLALPPLPAEPESAGLPETRSEAVEIACASGGIRKKGDWIRSRAYRFALKSSTARLDLTEYEGARGFRLEIEVDAVSSSLRVIVPRGFEVEDRFSDTRSSTVRNRPRGEAYGDNRVLLVGSLRSSTVRVKYR